KPEAEVLIQPILLEPLRTRPFSHPICTFGLKNLSGCFQEEREKSVLQIRRESFAA
ncbi:hypothetical protein V1527DRAFT_462381, partial [Lipomyces starkeyi]